jgi:hypothetical protein
VEAMHRRRRSRRAIALGLLLTAVIAVVTGTVDVSTVVPVAPTTPEAEAMFLPPRDIRCIINYDCPGGGGAEELRNDATEIVTYPTAAYVGRQFGLQGLTNLPGLFPTFTATGACQIVSNGTQGVAVGVGTAIGTCTIEAVATTEDPRTRTTDSVSFPVGIQEQRVFWVSPPQAVVRPGWEVVLLAGSTSTLPVTFDVSGPCTLAGNVVTATDVGSCTVTASQGGGNGYSAATPIQAVISATQGTQELFFPAPPPTTMTLGNVDRVINVRSTANLGPELSIAGPCALTQEGPYTNEGGIVTTRALVTPTFVGTCTLSASQPGNGDIGPAATLVASFEIRGERAPMEWVYAPPADLTVGTVAGIEVRSRSGRDITLGNFGFGGPPSPACAVEVTGRWVDADGWSHTAAVLTAVESGTCSITGLIPVGGPWLTNSFLTQGVTVSPQQVTLTLASETATYGGALPPLTTVAQVAGADLGTALPPIECEVVGLDVVGSTVVSPAGAYPVLCTAPATASRTVTIAPAELIVAAAVVDVELTETSDGPAGEVSVTGRVRPGAGHDGDLTAADVQVTVWAGTDASGFPVAADVQAVVSADGTFTATVPGLAPGAHTARAVVLPGTRYRGEASALHTFTLAAPTTTTTTSATPTSAPPGTETSAPPVTLPQAPGTSAPGATTVAPTTTATSDGSATSGGDPVATGGTASVGQLLAFTGGSVFVPALAGLVLLATGVALARLGRLARR